MKWLIFNKKERKERGNMKYITDKEKRNLKLDILLFKILTSSQNISLKKAELSSGFTEVVSEIQAVIHREETLLREQRERVYSLTRSLKFKPSSTATIALNRHKHNIRESELRKLELQKEMLEVQKILDNLSDLIR